MERVRQYQEAMARLDLDALGELRHPEYVCTYPQSGERFVGHEKWAAAHRNYASRFGRSDFEDATVKGGDQKTKVTTALDSPLPFFSTPIVQVSDTGELATIEGSGLWPDGKKYFFAKILEYRDGLVWRETSYFAEPFAAPEWRAPFTES